MKRLLSGLCTAAFVLPACCCFFAASVFAGWSTASALDTSGNEVPASCCGGSSTPKPFHGEDSQGCTDSCPKGSCPVSTFKMPEHPGNGIKAPAPQALPLDHGSGIPSSPTPEHPAHPTDSSCPALDPPPRDGREVLLREHKLLI